MNKFLVMCDDLLWGCDTIEEFDNLNDAEEYAKYANNALSNNNEVIYFVVEQTTENAGV